VPSKHEVVLESIHAGKRVSLEEYVTFYEKADLLELGALAHALRMTLHPANRVTYVVDRNINYTNVCISACRFCAFHRAVGSPEAYVLGREDLSAKIQETLELGGTQILLQGGMHPRLGLADMVSMLRYIKDRFPIHIHGFSPPEILHLSERERKSVEYIIEALRDAGLGSIPGGGAEILVDEVRSRISPRKCTSIQWLAVMRAAHSLGIPTTATMMFGHVETSRHRMEHLFKIRDLQEETGGFTAFIPWTFQPDHTTINVPAVGAVVYLRTLAISRLVLDNVLNLQASWVTQGAKVGQVALSFGANDLGSTMIEENVVAAAGVRFRLSESDMVRLILDAGFEPARRDTLYRLLEAVPS